MLRSVLRHCYRLNLSPYRVGERFLPHTNLLTLMKKQALSSSSLFNEENLLKSISNVEVQINEVSFAINQVENQIKDLDIKIDDLFGKPKLTKDEAEKKKYFLQEKASLSVSLRKEKAFFRKEKASLSVKEESLGKKKAGIA